MKVKSYNFSKVFGLLVVVITIVIVVNVLAWVISDKEYLIHPNKTSVDLLSESDFIDEEKPESEIGSSKDEGCEDEGDRLETELDVDQVKLIGKLSQGIRKLVRIRDHGNWYYCGEKLGEYKQIEVSTAIAYRTVVSQYELGLDVSPWGIIATAYNESGLDPCALGIYPRKWAYKKGMLRRKKFTCSHTRNEVLSFINNPVAKKRYSRSGFDLGICQVLSRFYRGQESDMLSITDGIRMCIIEMQRRGRRNKTNKPWLYWKGTNKTRWYRNRIRKWAKMMGASKKDMREI
jgi:hypothetical protein